MVVGKGLIAKCFSSYENSTEVLIFASGVSNSKNEIESEFQRELDLIKLNITFNGLFLYFSTCSIEDPSLQNSKYIIHKKRMETFIKNNCTNYFIVRLPNVIGKTTNKHTLTNYFIDCIETNSHFNIQKDAFRYIIDVKDVYTVIDNVIKTNTKINSISNLVVNEKILVMDMVEEIEKSFNKKANYAIIEGGCSYDINPDNIFKPHLMEIEKNSLTYFRNSILSNYSIKTKSSK